MSQVSVSDIAVAIGDPSISQTIDALKRRGAEEEELYPIIKDIFKKIGYRDDEIHKRINFSVQIGNRSVTATPDVTVKVGNDNILVIELKRPSHALSDSNYQQGLSYSVLIGIPYSLITNGVKWDLIEPVNGVMSWRQVASSGTELVDKIRRLRTDRTRLDEIGKEIEQLPNIQIHKEEAYKVLKTLSSTSEISDLFDRFNNVLRTEAGITDAKARLYEMMKLLTVKQLDEKRFYERGIIPQFIGLDKIDSNETDRKVHSFFGGVVIPDITGVFDAGEVVTIREPSVIYTIMRELSEYSLYKTRRDVIGLAYERFLSRVMVGRGIGDFFTPREIVNFLVETINPSPKCKIIDPACGTGGFLLESYNHIYDLHGSAEATRNRENLYGIDVDETIIKLCRVNMFLHIGNNWRNIVRKDSLQLSDLPEFALRAIHNPEEHGFDITLTNPPFGRGKNRNITDIEKLNEFENPIAKDDDGNVRKVGADPQTLFLELCLRLMKPGGRGGIVLDDGVLGNMSMPIGINKNEPVYLKFREWFMDKATIWSIVSLPQKAFEPYGSGAKTSLILFQKKYEGITEPEDVFLARANYIGYKLQRQKYEAIPNNDLQRISNEFHAWLDDEDLTSTFYGEAD